jgi:hypothetical protein
MLKYVLIALVFVVLVSTTQAAPKSSKAPTIKPSKPPSATKSANPAPSPGAKTSTKHAVHGAKHVAPPVKPIVPSPTKPPAVTKTPVIPSGAKLMKAKAVVPSSTGGAAAPTSPDVKLPEVSAFERGRRRRELDSVFGDGPLLMFEDLKHGIDFGEGDGVGPMIPETPGGRRTAPGSAIGGLGGANPAASSSGIGGSGGQPNPPPEPPPDDGGDVVGGGGGKPKQVMDFGIGKAAQTPPRPRPRNPDPPEPDDEMQADGGLQAAGLRGGGGGDGFREGPRTQPGGGDGDGMGGEEPPDFTKPPEDRKMPVGRVIQKPIAGPGGTIDPIDPIDPIGQPGPDGGNPTIMRSEPVDPLKRRMEDTDPAGGAGDAAPMP